MRAVIFANGKFDNPEMTHTHFQPGDILIAADGGLRHCQRLGILPAILIGDFDSLETSELEELRHSLTLVQHPSRKDYTDLELALLYVKDLGAKQVLVFGALGSRWDQTAANLLLPSSAAFEDLNIRMMDGLQEIFLIKEGEQAEISGQPGDIVSLVPTGGDAHGITTHGLEYPLRDDSLYLGSTRGVSNVLQDRTASIHLAKGSLLCICIHQNQE